MIQVMCHTGGYRNVDDMIREASSPSGMNRKALKDINDAIKNAKVKVSHLGHYKKAHCLGPPANSRESCFLNENKNITVVDYFNEKYKNKLPSGKLKYPMLPVIDVGTKSKPNYVPAELVDIPGGQSRSKVCTGQMTAAMIKVRSSHR